MTAQINLPCSHLSYCLPSDAFQLFDISLSGSQTVSVWGSGGRIELTVAKFMALQKMVQPDWYQSMADGETWQNGTSRKRVRKSVDRTLAHLDECLLLHQKSQVHTQLAKHTHTHTHAMLHL